MISISIYIIIILIIIFKAFYKSSITFIKFFSVRKNTENLYTSIQIESLPFFFNSSKINLLIFFINFFILIIFNFFFINNIAYCYDTAPHAPYGGETDPVEIPNVNMVALFENLPIPVNNLNMHNLNNFILTDQFPEPEEFEIDEVPTLFENNTSYSYYKAGLKKRLNFQTIDALSINSITGLNFNNIQCYSLIQNVILESNYLYLNSKYIVDVFMDFQGDEIDIEDLKIFISKFLFSNEQKLFFHNLSFEKIIDSFLVSQEETIWQKKIFLSHFLPVNLVNFIMDDLIQTDNSLISRYINIHKNLYVFINSLNLSIEKQLEYLDNVNGNINIDAIIQDENFNKYLMFYLEPQEWNSIEFFNSDYSNIVDSSLLNENQEYIDYLNSLKALNFNDFLNTISQENINTSKEFLDIANNIEEDDIETKSFIIFFLNKRFLNREFLNNSFNSN